MPRKLKNPDGYKPTIQVPEALKAKFNKWLDANRNPNQGATVGKILDWFLSQPMSVQHVVLGMVPPEAREVHSALMRKLADDLLAGEGVMAAWYDGVLTEPGAPTKARESHSTESTQRRALGRAKVDLGEETRNVQREEPSGGRGSRRPR